MSILIFLSFSIHKRRSGKAVFNSYGRPYGGTDLVEENVYTNNKNDGGDNVSMQSVRLEFNDGKVEAQKEPEEVKENLADENEHLGENRDVSQGNLMDEIEINLGAVGEESKGNLGAVADDSEKDTIIGAYSWAGSRPFNFAGSAPGLFCEITRFTHSYTFKLQHLPSWTLT